MEITLVILVVFQLVRYLINRERFRSLEERISDLSHEDRQAQIQQLTTRLYQLEKKLESMRAPAAPAATAPVMTVPEPAVPEFKVVREEERKPVQPPPLPVTPPPPVMPPPLPRVHVPKPEPEFTPEAAPEPVFEPMFAKSAPPAPEGPTLSERLREAMGGEEWEALVGGNLLNKLGALVLVVGIALFLGYSFANMAPAGRAATALATSFAILAGGIWTERAAKYRVFARGLIGAGWAGLYATAYAMYALPAAKVIDSPLAG